MTPSEIRLASFDLIEDLAELRLNKGLTQAEVARRAGTSAPCINYIEEHKRNPGLDVLLRYADAVGADVNVVMRRTNA